MKKINLIVLGLGFYLCSSVYDGKRMDIGNIENKE